MAVPLRPYTPPPPNLMAVGFFFRFQKLKNKLFFSLMIKKRHIYLFHVSTKTKMTKHKFFCSLNFVWTDKSGVEILYIGLESNSHCHVCRAGWMKNEVKIYTWLKLYTPHLQQTHPSLCRNDPSTHSIGKLPNTAKLIKIITFFAI